MKKEIREMLEQPFSAEQIKQRQGNFGQMLNYVESHEVIRRLNSTLEGEWNFQIMWFDIRMEEEEVLVQGRLSVGHIIREQFAGSKITKNREDGSIIDLSSDLKSAATKCLVKIASTYGVGLHLYRNDIPAKTHQNNYPDNRDRGNGGHKNDRGNGGYGNGNGRATAKQIKAIFAISQDKGISNKAVRDLCVDEFGKLPDYLSKSEASEIIQDLSAR